MHRIARTMRDQWAGFLALFIVFAGGTAYAANTVGSSDIINGEVKQVDIAANAVGGAEIIDDAVRGPDVKESTLDFTVLQRRVSGCPAGQAIASVNAAGIPTCVAAATGPPSGAAGGALTGNYPNPQLAPNSVTSAKVLDETLSGTDLASNSVGFSELQSGSVTGGIIADGGVDSEAILDNSIESVDVKNADLTGADVAPNSLEGDEIATNTLDDEIADAGVTSAKLSDNAITSRIYTRSAASADVDNLRKEVTATCDAGDAVTGGGHVIDTHGTFDGDMVVERSYAVDSRTWLVRILEYGCFPCGQPWQLTVVANCVG